MLVTILLHLFWGCGWGTEMRTDSETFYAANIGTVSLELPWEGQEDDREGRHVLDASAMFSGVL